MHDKIFTNAKNIKVDDLNSDQIKIKKTKQYEGLTNPQQLNIINYVPTENLCGEEDIIDKLIKEKIEFSFIDYFKSTFQSKNKRNLYQNAIENLDLIMDIETYLKFHLDMILVKEVLFDETQRTVFDNVTKLITLKKVFEKQENSYVSFSNYKKEDYEDCFKAIKKILSRNSYTDKKLIGFLDKRIYN